MMRQSGPETMSPSLLTFPFRSLQTSLTGKLFSNTAWHSHPMTASSGPEAPFCLNSLGFLRYLKALFAMVATG